MMGSNIILELAGLMLSLCGLIVAALLGVDVTPGGIYLREGIFLYVAIGLASISLIWIGVIVAGIIHTQRYGNEWARDGIDTFQEITKTICLAAGHPEKAFKRLFRGLRDDTTLPELLLHLPEEQREEYRDAIEQTVGRATTKTDTLYSLVEHMVRVENAKRMAAQEPKP